ncbi:DNA-binding protein [Streptomyces sp. NPDC052236]|uniref:DNA-binding protein n=1 Tax=Streptomyces sp. NPDC052236 TaxID=3365686 RepID=UPI0037CEBAF0
MPTVSYRADQTSAAFRAEDPDQARARREHVALARIAERHLRPDTEQTQQTQQTEHTEHTEQPNGPEQSGRAGAQQGPRLTAQEAIHLVTSLASRTAQPTGATEVDTTDILAALTLLPSARAELEALEASLSFLARERGMTWSEIAFGLGLRSAQAAQQRCERSISRMEDHTPASDASTVSNRKRPQG